MNMASHSPPLERTFYESWMHRICSGASHQWVLPSLNFNRELPSATCHQVNVLDERRSAPCAWVFEVELLPVPSGMPTPAVRRWWAVIEDAIGARSGNGHQIRFCFDFTEKRPCTFACCQRR